jgi:aspartate aminotransferase
MKHVLADKLAQVKPSPTMQMTARANKMRAEGRDVIGLSAGEPDFATPAHVKEAAIVAINNNHTGYTAVDGIPALKDAIIAKLKRDNQLDYTAKQVLVSCGAKHSIYNAYQALLNPGDEVIIPAPYWVSYPDMALLAGAKPVIIAADAKQNFKITAEQLEAAITDKTKLLILNSPSNPTGMVYTHAELQALAEVLLRHPHVYIISDDIYEAITWTDEPYANILMQNPELYDRTIVVNGVSKAYAMTGWRIGYAAGPEAIIAGMKTIQSQSTSNPTSISQHAALDVLNGSQECITEMVTAYQRRQKIALDLLNSMPGVTCSATDGAFYLFPDVSAAMQKLAVATDVEFAELILEQAEVAVVPGSAFGLAGHIRISYATSDELLKEALLRITNVL